MNRSDASNQRFFEDTKLMSNVLNSKKLSDINPKDYRAIVFAGGHGTMWDLPESKDVQRVTASIYENNGVVTAVCHGPAALVTVKLKTGEPLVKGKKFASFIDLEEKQAGLSKVFPFLLRSKLEELGGEHVYALPWSENAVADQRLVTGQNPQPAHLLGELVVKEVNQLN